MLDIRGESGNRSHQKASVSAVGRQQPLRPCGNVVRQRIAAAAVFGNVNASDEDRCARHQNAKRIRHDLELLKMKIFGPGNAGRWKARSRFV